MTQDSDNNSKNKFSSEYSLFSGILDGLSAIRVFFSDVIWNATP